MLEAMIQNHVSSNMSTYTKGGKGRGLTILLHGEPDTGKTLTAECLPKQFEMPLYKVTCRELGDDEESLDKYLDSAILLLEGCEALLKQRERRDIQGNALFSTFLRRLEDSKGIIISTSGMITLDDAFKPRIHLSLHYPSLSTAERLQMWTHYIRRLEEQQISTVVYGKTEINGREIRNAIMAAKQLARYLVEPLRFSHLQQSVRTAKSFEQWLEETRAQNGEGLLPAEVARME
ncbi:P-loop containing nucleoside triphosphate hydrolase protein [Immersiella caudata]|uniref:P-loop containing nucleoside triphosphate hydrolase protein n=1 Tax=Immersiella caudata TaxID=314043 RepID=A0AA39WLR1_9PEZI|nr:P-loop containing nucleoside triphosphate hydrolase protein [Immersiella caudata]